MPHFSVPRHIHKRERIHLKKEKYPHPDKAIRALDKICLAFSVLMPATAIPQIWKIYTTHDVSGISLSMWVLFTIGVIPFIIYGIVHKAKPILILNILWLIAEIVMIIGIVTYM